MPAISGAGLARFPFFGFGRRQVILVGNGEGYGADVAAIEDRRLRGLVRQSSGRFDEIRRSVHHGKFLHDERGRAFAGRHRQ